MAAPYVLFVFVANDNPISPLIPIGLAKILLHDLSIISGLNI
jgi:hypothetical protein